MGSFFHRHPGLTPYLLLSPALLWLGIFFLVPLYYMGRTSLETGLCSYRVVKDLESRSPNTSRPSFALKWQTH